MHESRFCDLERKLLRLEQLERLVAPTSHAHKVLTDIARGNVPDLSSMKAADWLERVKP